MSGFRCPDCPKCGQPPREFPFKLAGQEFCGNDDCDVLIWNPEKSQAENLADQGSVEPPFGG